MTATDRENIQEARVARLLYHVRSYILPNRLLNYRLYKLCFIHNSNVAVHMHIKLSTTADKVAMS